MAKHKYRPHHTGFQKKEYYKEGDLDPIFLKKEPREEIAAMFEKEKLLPMWLTEDGDTEVRCSKKDFHAAVSTDEYDKWLRSEGLNHFYDKHHGEWLKILVKWKMDKIEKGRALERLLESKL